MDTQKRVLAMLNKVRENKLQRQKLGTIDDFIKNETDNLDSKSQQYIEKSMDLASVVYEFITTKDNLISKLQQFSNINIDEVNELIQAYEELKIYTGIDRPAYFSMQDIEVTINTALEIIDTLESINVNL